MQLAKIAPLHSSLVTEKDSVSKKKKIIFTADPENINSQKQKEGKKKEVIKKHSLGLEPELAPKTKYS